MLFDRLYNKERPDIIEAPPEKGLKRFLFLAVDHFPRLVLLNLLFLTCCLPVVTIPASLSGMNRVLINLVREGDIFEWHVFFFKEFKNDYFQRMFLWLPMGGIEALLLFFPGLARDFPLLLGAGMLFFFFFLFVQCYWFPMMVLLDLKAVTCLKNAILMTLTQWKCNLKLLLPVGLLLIVIMVLPYTILMLFFGIVFIQLLICTFTNEAIQKLVITSNEQTSHNRNQT